MDKIQDDEIAAGNILTRPVPSYLRYAGIIAAVVYIYQQFNGHPSKPAPAPTPQPQLEAPQLPPNDIPEPVPQQYWRLEPKPMWQFDSPGGSDVPPPVTPKKPVV